MQSITDALPCGSRFSRILVVGGSITCFCSLASLKAPAATFTSVASDGRIRSGSADFSSVGNILTIRITNTTPETRNVNDLLKSIDFSLNGLSPTLVSVTGMLRYIDLDGNAYDSEGTRDLSWSLKALDEGRWQLNYHPDAQNAIVGPPTDGDYADANRSIRGNNGHNPFAAEVAIATLNVPGLENASRPIVRVLGFGFNAEASAQGVITPDGAMEIPEPAGVVLMVLGALALGHRRRSTYRLTSNVG